MLRNIFCWKGFGPVTGPPSFPGANFQQMVIARLSLGLSFLGLRNFLKLCHDEKPCTWWLGEKGLGSLQSRLARMLHHEYDALKGYRFWGGAISFYSVSCMSDVIFNPSLLNWSSLILTVAHNSCPPHFFPTGNPKNNIASHGFSSPPRPLRPKTSEFLPPPKRPGNAERICWWFRHYIVRSPVYYMENRSHYL